MFCLKLLICHKYLCFSMLIYSYLYTYSLVLEHELNVSRYKKMFTIAPETAQRSSVHIEQTIPSYANDGLCSTWAFYYIFFVLLSKCHPGAVLRSRGAASPGAGKQEDLSSSPCSATNHQTSLACTLLISEMRVLGYMIRQAPSSSRAHWWGHRSWGAAWQPSLFSLCITDIIQKLPPHEYRCGLSV